MCSLLSGCFESPPQIISLNPPRGSLGVQADTPVVVQFDRPVVPSSLAGRVSVFPDIPGCDLSAAFTSPLTTDCRAVWISGDTAFVLQHPRAIFAPLKQYTFTVLGGFYAPDGTVNSVDHRWNITTGSAPQVRAVSPADGATDVPVDSTIGVDFSGGMAATATAAAIRLDPQVPGTRVVRSALDASRFVVLPGALLRPDTGYTLSISRAATDQHHQPLQLAVRARFSTGAVAAGGHAVVLVARAGEGPTRVLLTALSPVEVGVPVAQALVLEAPRCNAASGCGAAHPGQPLYTISAATLSPGGRWLAVVERDATALSSRARLVILDAARGAEVTTLPGGDLPAWSSDGSTLAYSAGGNAALYTPASGASRALPPGAPLVAPPAWDPAGELLALEVAEPGTPPHVELADAVVGARYALPGVDGAAQDPVFSPDGRQLAFFREGRAVAGTWIVEVGAGSAAPRRLDPALRPVGFLTTGALLGVAASGSGSAALVRVDVDSDDHVDLARQPAQLSLATITVSSSLRRFAFLAPDARGVQQAFLEDADGSTSFAITSLDGGVSALGVELSGGLG